MKRLLCLLLVSLLLVVSVSADNKVFDDTNFTGKNIYSVNLVNASGFYDDGVLLTNTAGGGGNTSFNESHTDTLYIAQGDESSLNVNSSGYWILFNNYNSTQVENNGGIFNIIPSWLTSFVNSVVVGVYETVSNVAVINSTLNVVSTKVDNVNTTVNVEGLGFTQGSHTVDTNTNETIRVGILETKVTNVNTSSNIVNLIGSHTTDTNTNESVRVAQNENDIQSVNSTAEGKASVGTCGAGSFVVNTTTGGVVCGTPSGSGDITAVNTNGKYLSGGAGSGDVSLLFVESELNTSIDAKTNGFINGGVINAWKLVEANITDLSHTVDTNTNESVRVGLLETKVTNVNTSSNIINLIGAHTVNTNTNESIRVDLLETKVTNVNTTANIENLNFVQGAHTTDTTYTNGSGLSLIGTEFNHSDTSSQASSDNSGKTFIQDVLLDTFGHVTSLVVVAADFISSGTNNAWVIAGENITSGTVADVRIASTIARDSEVVAKGTINAWQVVKANVTDWDAVSLPINYNSVINHPVNCTGDNYFQIGSDNGSRICGAVNLSSVADTNLSPEQVEDIVGDMWSGNTETRVTVTYQDADGTIDIVVDDMNDDIPEAGDFGNAADLDANGEVADDSHNHVYSNIDVFTEANLYSILSDVTQFYEVGDKVGDADTLDTHDTSYFQIDLTNEASLYTALSDVSEFIETNDAATLTTLDTGQGANELYDMNQNVLTTSNIIFNNQNLTGNLTMNGGFLQYYNGSCMISKIGNTQDVLCP